MQSIKLIAPNLPPPASCVCPNLSSPAVQEKNVRAGNCSALWEKKNNSDTTRQSPPNKKFPSGELSAGSGLPPLTFTFPPPGTLRENQASTLVSPSAFNLAKQTCSTSPFGKQDLLPLPFPPKADWPGGVDQEKLGPTRPGQRLPYGWVWGKQPRLKPGSN